MHKCGGSGLSGCRYEYSFDNGTLLASSHGANSSGNASDSTTTGVNGTAVDTIVRLLTPPLCSVDTAVVAITVTGHSGHGPVTAPPHSAQQAATGAEVRLDSAAAWVDVSALAGYNSTTGQLTITGLVDGYHSVEVRYRWGAGEVVVLPYCNDYWLWCFDVVVLRCCVVVLCPSALVGCFEVSTP